jgi:hypothetical protein
MSLQLQEESVLLLGPFKVAGVGRGGLQVLWLAFFAFHYGNGGEDL